MTTKVVETTPERLIIQHQKYKHSQVIQLSFWVNLAVTVFVYNLAPHLLLSPQVLLVLVGAIAWGIIHWLFPINRRENLIAYCFAVAFGIIPRLGTFVLFLPVFSLFIVDITLPDTTVTLDKTTNLLKIKTHFLCFYTITRYPLEDIIGANFYIGKLYVSGLTMIDAPILYLNRRRRRDGKIVQKSVFSASIDILQSTVNQINAFLLSPVLESEKHR